MRSDLILEKIEKIHKVNLSPLDLLPHEDLREKIVALALQGVPDNAHSLARTHLSDLRRQLLDSDTDQVKVVVFGGGSGLSNIIGGDSRLPSWKQKPFGGLKEIFPQTRSIVCITDNGGSTGELLKDLPLVAIGDMRHVLLSSIQFRRIQQLYNITLAEALVVAGYLSDIFNWRFTGPLSMARLEEEGIKAKMQALPIAMRHHLQTLMDHLFLDERLAETLQRSHCFGNLLITAAIYRHISDGLSNEELASDQKLVHVALMNGLQGLTEHLGAVERAVLPCTSTPAQLRVTYTNGVVIPGEHRLSKADRRVPVDSVDVDYFGSIMAYDEVIQDILEADIVILAPGSLYSSIIPVFKVPRLAEAVRANTKALKVLVSNLWVQTGETDLSLANPERKFHVSDMIRAYEKNIEGGTRGLFNEVICISLYDIPASILQSYAVEGKIPIFLDREEISSLEYVPIECGVYSRIALAERGVIQHDPDTLALAIKGLFCTRKCYGKDQKKAAIPTCSMRIQEVGVQPSRAVLPFQRYTAIMERMRRMPISSVGEGGGSIDVEEIRSRVGNILWDHPVIPLRHLDFFNGIQCIEPKYWNRDQQWDNVFSFYDPADKDIKIRADQVGIDNKLEIALMIALGESLLGDYAKKKVMTTVVMDNICLGMVYHLYVKDSNKMQCFFSPEHLHIFLTLARMCASDDPLHYTRLVNKGEGFTPPGLLMGLMYAWYIDNRFATHIEYKMSVMKISRTDLIPEQLRMAGRRKNMIGFFKEVIFNQD